MGHYCSIKFTSNLSELGAEIIEYLQNHSLLEASQTFTYYPFIEACYNRYQWAVIPITIFDKNNKIWKVDWEHKIKFYERPLKFLIPYLTTKETNFIYSSEHSDWVEFSITLCPKTPIIQWDRKFGDPTGIEIY